MRTKIGALSDFSTENRANNCVWLLGEIKGVTHQFDTKRNIFLSLLDARIAYFSCKQTQQQTDTEYLEVFRANVEVLEYYKANISESHLLVDNLGGTLTEVECKKIARGCTIAMAFLRGADPRRYSALWSDLANQKTRGNDQYPKDLTAAYSMLVNYHAPSPNRQHQGSQSHQAPPTSSVTVPPVDAHTFAQSTTSTTVATKAGSDHVFQLQYRWALC
jgi:hypothetical protein